jgi:hypothetical protein
VTYTWKLKHRPAKGIINVEFSCSELNETIASGDIYDSEYRGGRLGVYTLSQRNVTFSHVKYSCPSKLDYALQFDGVSGYIDLPIGTRFHQNPSFTLMVWVKLPLVANASINPLICSHHHDMLCLYVENGVLKARLNGEVTYRTGINSGEWNNIAMVYDSRGKHSL